MKKMMINQLKKEHNHQLIKKMKTEMNMKEMNQQYHENHIEPKRKPERTENNIYQQYTHDTFFLTMAESVSVVTYFVQ